jgi:hypothetical protein
MTDREKMKVLSEIAEGIDENVKGIRFVDFTLLDEEDFLRAVESSILILEGNKRNDSKNFFVFEKENILFFVVNFDDRDVLITKVVVEEGTDIEQAIRNITTEIRKRNPFFLRWEGNN